ncbi:hypothetical protein [Wenjunlia tyrosinilytica]|uniref:Membrane protein n=1 Tax=Wenjunlia tyrosinilytica TaxID=1544741 RepID=A0A917ZP88_9ACTN|nr:hypothetical protein [Wenjunlia tyrosinilytica]GGO86367.1 membrane protein [Wenjunlia tyrosinilytica]
MYMNSAPHLQSEDRPEFERVLDEALHDEDTRLALSSSATHLNSEQLRTLALGATSTIAACAAAEYQQYLKIREQVREATAGVTHRDTGPDETVEPGTSGEAAAGTSGAGLLSVVAVLTPILAGTAAVIFLVTGYALELMDPDPAIARPLRGAGWLFAAIAAAGIVVGMVALLLTAIHNPAADAESVRVMRSPEVAAARDAWRRALLERGVRPYLHQVLAASAAGELPAPHGAAETVRRTPPLGYSRPGFSSPNPDDPSTPRRGPEFSSPDYSSPDFSSPDFDTGSPDHPGADRA